MAGATNVQEAAMLDAIDFTGWYIALIKTDVASIADDGTGAVEVTGTNYARAALANSHWASAIAGAPSTKAGPTGSTTWVFSSSTVGSAWAPSPGVQSWAIFTAISGGTMRFFGALTTPKIIASGDPVPQFDSTHQVTLQLGDQSDTF